MSEATTPRQFLCEWESRGGRLQGDDGLSGEDEALARWRGVNRVASRKLRAANYTRPELSSACYTIGASGAASTSGRRHIESLAKASNGDMSAAVGVVRSQPERVSGVAKRPRPQSACSAAARQRQLERSHAVRELETSTPDRSMSGRVRQRPQSAKSRSSTTTPRLSTARGDLMNGLETSKWTDMLHRSPCFRQSSLQRLEAETYALLRFALRKTSTRNATKATDGTHQRHRRRKAQQREQPILPKRAESTRPASAKLQSKLGTRQELGASSSTSGIACGSGVQVARTKKQQRQYRMAGDLHDGLARETRRQSPRSEQEPEASKADPPDLGPRNESSGSDGERCALRERTRLRGNDMKRKAAKKKATALPGGPRGKRDDGAPALGRRTAARSHWTARASLALLASARPSGGDADRSLRIDEYVLAVAETVVPQVTTDQQPARVKKNSAAPQITTKKKRQTVDTPVSAARLPHYTSKSRGDGEGLIGGVRNNTKVQSSALNEEQERCKEAVTATQATQDEDTTTQMESSEVGDVAGATPAGITGTPGDELANAREEQWEGGVAPETLSTGLSSEPRDLSPLASAPGSPRLNGESGVTTDPGQMSQEDLGEHGELVTEVSALNDENDGDFASQPFPGTKAVRASVTPVGVSERTEGTPSEPIDGWYAVFSSARHELDAGGAVCTQSTAVDDELGDTRENENAGNTACTDGAASLGRPAADCDDRPDLGTEDHREPTTRSSSPRSDQDFHPNNSSHIPTRSHFDEPDNVPGLCVAPPSSNAGGVSDIPMLQDASVKPSPSTLMLVSEATSELVAEPVGVSERTVSAKESDKERDAGRHVSNDAMALKGVDTSSEQLTVDSKCPDDHGIDVETLVSNNGGASKDPSVGYEDAGSSGPENTGPEQVVELDHALLPFSKEASKIVPVLTITVARASAVSALDDTAVCPVSTNSVLYSNDWELSEKEAGALISPSINAGSGNDAVPATGEVQRNTSHDSVDGYSNISDIGVSADRTSSSCIDSDSAQPASANPVCVDECGEPMSGLAGKLTECEPGQTEGSGGEVQGQETLPWTECKAGDLMSSDVVAMSVDDAVARAEADSAQATSTPANDSDAPMRSIESSESTDSSGPLSLDDSTIASGVAFEEVLDGHAPEQHQFKDESEDTGDELLPDERAASMKVCQDLSAQLLSLHLSSFGNLVDPRCAGDATSANYSEVGGSSGPSQASRETNAQPMSKHSTHVSVAPECDAASLEASASQDTNNPVVSVDVATSESVLVDEVPTDHSALSVMSARDCSICADRERGVSHDYPIKPGTSDDDVPCQEVSSGEDEAPSALVEPVTMGTAEPEASANYAESTSTFVDEQDSPLGEILAPTTEDLHPDTVASTSSELLQAADDPDSLPIESARRIQRQYRCFIARRLLLDQLQFYLNHQRRQARKRAKRESLRASVVLATDRSDADDRKEELVAHDEGGITATIPLAAAANAVSSEDSASPSSASEVVGTIINASEEKQATHDGEEASSCVQRQSEPQLDDCLSQDRGISIDSGGAGSRQRGKEDIHNHTGASSVSSEAGEAIQSGDASQPRADECDSPKIPSGSMNAPARPSDPLDPDSVAYDDDCGNLLETRSSGGEQSVSQADHLAIAHTNEGISPIEHRASSELSGLDDADGNAEHARSDSEHEMNEESQHNNPNEVGDTATQDDHGLQEVLDGQSGSEPWERYVDATSNKSFYYNRKTGESQWTALTEGIPIDTALDFELISTPAVAPDEPEPNLERISSADKDPDALSSQAHWGMRRHSSQLGEQRSGWQAFVDETTQQTFYYNSATGESTWAPPLEFEAAASSYLVDAPAESPLLDDPWVLCVDPASGLPYYANLVTNETSWEKPPRMGEGSSGASAVPASINMCELALEGGTEAADHSTKREWLAPPWAVAGDGDSQTPWTAGAVECVHDDRRADVDTPYEDDYVIDFDDETRD